MMNTYYISAAMLGDDATNADAKRMADLLQERGYDAEVGDSLSQSEDAIPDKVWDDCLDILSNEKYAA